jgi:hypothetical protein
MLGLVSAAACSSGSTKASPSADAAVQGDGSAEAGVVACPAATAGPTMHAGDLTADETWTAAGSPHVLTANVNVRNGFKLTIEPCAVVQAAKDVRLAVAYPLTPNTGTLVAAGTAQKPIHFSGQGGVPWANIYVEWPGTAELRYVTLEGGGSSDGSNYGSTLHVIGDGVLPADPTVLLDHVTIKGSTGSALWMQDGATFVSGSTDVVVTGSGNDANPYPVLIEEHSMDGLPTGTYTGNKVDEIRLSLRGDGIAGDGLTVDATLHDRGVPYSVNGSFGIGALGKSTATMTIEPGVTMKFEAGTTFNVQLYSGDQPAAAALVAVGTAAKPIVFTSASATPAAGDWTGLWFGGALDPKNRLDYVHVEYAGGSCSCVVNTCSDVMGHDDAAIMLGNVPPGAFITNTTISDSALHGIFEAFTGDLVNFRPTNTFIRVPGCVQTLPKAASPASCPNPLPACDGM